ncbi:MAG: hypothetical protein ACI8RZ_007878, partial [Myxococcota bacterium]
MNISTLILTTLLACDGKADTGGEETGDYDTCYGEPMIPQDFDWTTEVDDAALESLVKQHGLAA